MDSVLTEEQGRSLLQTARQTIAGGLGVVAEENSPVHDTALDAQYATFVTLKINGALRGCIGNLVPVGSVLDGVKRNAVHAAFNDSRFPALTDAELANVQIDISVLSQPRPLEYRDGDDLLEKLRPGRDGVILKLGGASATFLPQVWEQLPVPENFLGHLCQKAGLTATAWRESHPEIEIYQVQCFAEEQR